MSENARITRPPSEKALVVASYAERIAVILGLAVALRFLIRHQISGFWLIALAVALASYAYAVYARRGR